MDKNNNMVVEENGIVLQELDVHIPNGTEMRKNNITFKIGHDISTSIRCFVLPKNTKLKIGSRKEITTVEYTFQFLPETLFSQHQDTAFTIDGMQSRFCNFEPNVKILPNYV